MPRLISLFLSLIISHSFGLFFFSLTSLFFFFSLSCHFFTLSLSLYPFLALPHPIFLYSIHSAFVMQYFKIKIYPRRMHTLHGRLIEEECTRDTQVLGEVLPAVLQALKPRAQFQTRNHTPLGDIINQ